MPAVPASRTASGSTVRARRAAARSSVTALVRALNEPGRGALLDALVEVRARASREGRAEDAGAPAAWAAETLAALAEGLLERQAQAGIRPLCAPGEVLSLTPGQLARGFEYHGGPFGPTERRKRVVVAAPGWAVGRRTVVRPVVREVPAEDPG
jgi:hypothetical protein